jgi:hypothetical protein
LLGLKALGVKQGRPRHHLHADDPGGGLRDARLRADRRGPFGGVRRLLAGQRSPAASRIAQSKVVITADEGLRGGKLVPLKANVDAAIAKAAASTGCSSSPHRRRRRHEAGRDVWYHDAAEMVTTNARASR